MMCLNPMVIQVTGRGDMIVPCGQCRWCRVLRSSNWAMRMMHEVESWDSSVFITLTYNNDFLPGDRNLSKREFQLFIKRLRKEVVTKIKYYGCGEYGEKYGRPHYHAIVFGVSCNDVRIIEKAWPFGFVKVGNVTSKSCKYVSKYINKAPLGKSRIKEIEDGRVPPFQLSSKGLGLSWLMENVDRVGAQGIRYHGKQKSLPRYYIKKLKERGVLQDRIVEESRLESLQASNKLHQDLRAKGISFYDYLEARIEDVKSKDSLYSRIDSDNQ